MTGHGYVKALEEKKSKDQLLHPWSCYRNEEGEIVLVYCIIDHSIAIVGITKQQIDSLREELKSFVFLDMELNQSSTPNCPNCNSDLVQEEGHEFGDPDGEETGIIDHFHCTDCGQDFLKDGTKLVKHSETSLVAKEEK